MIKGLILGLSACLIWSLIFIVPGYMEGFGTVEIALGRYLFYGIISLPFFLIARVKGRCRYPLALWIKVAFFSFMCTFGYYLFMVFALRCSGTSICALISGVSPITIAFYGNWRQKEVKFKSLLIPSALIFLGLLAINAPQLTTSDTASYYWIGVLSAFCSVASWTWYVVANARFLRTHPDIEHVDWATLIGVGGLCWTVILGGLYVFFGPGINFAKFAEPAMLTKFLTGCAILGFFCSWVGASLWNRSSVLIPVSLAGQLTIFETIFAVVLSYILQQALPPPLESVGILLFLTAIGYSMRVSYRSKQIST